MLSMVYKSSLYYSQDTDVSWQKGMRTLPNVMISKERIFIIA